MVKERHPTPEERRLWREVTKHDEKFRHALIDDEPLAPEPPSLAEPAMPHAPLAKRTSPRAALELLDVRSAARLFKPHARPEATLDLHGMSKLDAYDKVPRFIERAMLAGIRHVLIITGKGRSSEGVLRANLLHWLNEPRTRSMVSGVAHAPDNKGGSGVFHVLLRAR